MFVFILLHHFSIGQDFDSYCITYKKTTKNADYKELKYISDSCIINEIYSSPTTCFIEFIRLPIKEVEYILTMTYKSFASNTKDSISAITKSTYSFKQAKKMSNKYVDSKKIQISSNETVNFINVEKNLKERPRRKIKVTYLDETKELNGYLCKNAIVTVNRNITYELWYAEIEELKHIPVNKFSYYEKIPGIVMEEYKDGNLLKKLISIERNTWPEYEWGNYTQIDDFIKNKD